MDVAVTIAVERHEVGLRIGTTLASDQPMVDFERHPRLFCHAAENAPPRVAGQDDGS